MIASDVTLVICFLFAVLFWNFGACRFLVVAGGCDTSFCLLLLAASLICLRNSLKVSMKH